MRLTIMDEESKDQIIAYIRGLDPEKKYKVDVMPYAEIDEELADSLDEVSWRS